MPSGIYYHKKGWHHSKRAKLKIAKFRKGKHHSVIVREQMSELKVGKNNPKWKGGKIKYHNGWYVLKSDHPFATKAGYIRQSRLIMERIIGRYLKPEEVVHHINEDCFDDRPENLMFFPSKPAHTRFHRLLRNSR